MCSVTPSAECVASSGMASGVRLAPLEPEPSDGAVEAAATRIQAVARGRRGRAMLGGLGSGLVSGGESLVEGLTKIEEAVGHGARFALERSRSGLNIVEDASRRASLRGLELSSLAQFVAVMADQMKKGGGGLVDIVSAAGNLFGWVNPLNWFGGGQK